ncbi:unnamed protein product, partial [Lymnaea stagnalis]
VVIPPLSVFGFVGNIFCCKILVRSGMGKPSNIILFALAIADLCTVQINVARILYTYAPSVQGNQYGWMTDYNTAVCAYLYLVAVTFIQNVGSYTSASFSVVITIERLIAVFLPLRFASIVSPARAWLVVSAVYLFWMPWCLFAATLYRFDYAMVPFYNTSVGRAKYTDFFYANFDIITNLNFNIINTLSTAVPLVFVTVGCIIVSVKIKVNLRKRQKMTSSTKKTSSTHTTATLLVICFVFVFSHSIVYLSDLISNSLLDFRDTSSLLKTINSSSNFIIYIILNPKFRKIFIEIITRGTFKSKLV